MKTFHELHNALEELLSSAAYEFTKEVSIEAQKLLKEIALNDRLSAIDRQVLVKVWDRIQEWNKT